MAAVKLPFTSIEGAPYGIKETPGLEGVWDNHPSASIAVAAAGADRMRARWAGLET